MANMDKIRSQKEKPMVNDNKPSLIVISQIPQKCHYLHDTWNLFSHEKEEINNNWTLDGYEKLGIFTTVEEFWKIYNNIDITNGMFYLMRQNYPPIWDDPKNINGGAWTFRVDKKILNRFWVEISLYCVGATICHHSATIVGF